MSRSKSKPGALWIVLTGATLALVLGMTWLHVRRDYGYMRIRNALLVDRGELADFRWPGDAPPHDFRIEQNVPDDFREIADAILGPEATRGGAFESALRIAEHLAPSGRKFQQRVQGATREAYPLIREGYGNCSDYTQVFDGIALAAGIPVREWGLFFDDYGGRGHAFNEIWDAERRAWYLIDSHKSFYPTDRSNGEPLSVLEFRRRLLAGEGIGQLALVPIDPPVFVRLKRSEEWLLEYYRRGLEQLGLWYGNDVFTYDDRPLVRAARPLPPALEQGLTIVTGIHPRMRILATATNRPAIDAMFRARNVFLGLVVLAGLLSVILALQIRARLKAAAADGRGKQGLPRTAAGP